MYNKRFFRKIHDKKVLHKIGKRWAVLSVSLLGAFGLTGMATSHVHANRVDNDTPNSTSVNNQQTQPKEAELIPLVQSSQTKSTSTNNTASNSEASTTNEIQKEAGLLHQRILTNGIQAIGRHNSSNVATQPDSNNENNLTLPNQRHSYRIVTGQWGTAPFKFDRTTGLLETTGRGQISSIKDLNNPKVQLNRIRSIQFAPGTTAPGDSSDLFAAGYDAIHTTDGPSDGIAYVSQLRNLKKIDLSHLDTSKVNDMTKMFLNDSDLQDITFGPRFNTKNVESMSGMFESDLKLKSLDLRCFNTDNVLDMDSMFESDYALSALNLGPNFNTHNTVYMYSMFRSDNALKHLDLGDKFGTDYVIDIPSLNNHGFSHMFADDYDLASLNLGPNFDTRKATDFSDMFANDSDLPALNLGRKFSTAQATDLHNLFKGDSALKYLNLGSNFDTTLASTHNYSGKSSDKDPYGIPNVTVQYHGADGIFTGDNELNTMVMNNTRLTPGAKLSNPARMRWYLTNNNVAQGKPVNLTDDQLYTGTYSLCTDVPVVATVLNYVDNTNPNNHNMLVNRVPIYGLKGDLISYGTVVNRIKNGYQLDIPFKDYMKTFPNLPFKYQSGDVTINVKPVPAQAKQDYDSESAASYAAAGASEADSRIAKYYQNSVSTSVKTADQQRAESTARDADSKIANSYQNSVKSAVANENQSLANQAASSADQRIKASEEKSVAGSVSIVNYQLAKSAARSADQSLDNSYARSAASSADLQIEQSIASSYASSVDQQIEASERKSVTNSVSIANQQQAQMAADSADRKIESSEAQSIAQSTAAKDVSKSSAPLSIRSTSSQNSAEPTVQSTSQSANNPSSESTVNSKVRINHLVTSSTPTSVSSQTVVSESVSVASSTSAVNQRIRGSQAVTQSVTKPSVVKPTRVTSVSQRLTSQPVGAHRETRAIIYDNNDRNTPVNRLKLRQKLMIGKKSVTREPVRIRKVRLKHRCVVHHHLVRVGHVRDTSKVLKRGTTIRIEKKFKVTSGHESVNNYEIQANNQPSFVATDELFPTSANLQPNELWQYPIYGKAWRRYYRVLILKACFTYKHGHRKKRLHRGSIVHVKGIIFTGRKGHRKECLLLTNGQLITASRKYVKLV